jgi:hypothetical protein
VSERLLACSYKTMRDDFCIYLVVMSSFVISAVDSISQSNTTSSEWIKRNLRMTRSGNFHQSSSWQPLCTNEELLNNIQVDNQPHKAWWDSKPELKFAAMSETLYPGLGDAIGRIFETTSKTSSDIFKIREYHNKFSPDKVRAAVVILAKSIHCGINCESPNARKKGISGCTQLQSVSNLIVSLASKTLLSSYPIIIFHEDWTQEDMDQVLLFRKQYFLKLQTHLQMPEEAVPIFWQKVNFGETSLPLYMDNREAIVRFMRQAHPNCDVTISNLQLHGFGYRTMCRFFSGLIFHAPLLNEFDYFLRLDGGDSRLRQVNSDPFITLKLNSAIYGYTKHFGKAAIVSDMFGKLSEKFFLTTKPTIHVEPNLFAFFNQGNLYYNNFEVVDMKPFRSPMHWDFFRSIDKAGIFMCQYGAIGSDLHTCSGSPTDNVIGDADFRTLALSLIAPSESSVLRYSESDLAYAHPVPNWCTDV